MPVSFQVRYEWRALTDDGLLVWVSANSRDYGNETLSQSFLSEEAAIVGLAEFIKRHDICQANSYTLVKQFELSRR